MAYLILLWTEEACNCEYRKIARLPSGIFQCVQLHQYQGLSAGAYNFQGVPLTTEWEMPKNVDVDIKMGKSSLVHLKYTYRFRNQFGE